MTKKETKNKLKALAGGKIPDDFGKGGISPVHKESYEYAFPHSGVLPVAVAINKLKDKKKK